jgi:hypothetical protein
LTQDPLDAGQTAEGEGPGRLVPGLLRPAGRRDEGGKGPLKASGKTLQAAQGPKGVLQAGGVPLPRKNRAGLGQGAAGVGKAAETAEHQGLFEAHVPPRGLGRGTVAPEPRGVPVPA